MLAVASDDEVGLEGRITTLRLQRRLDEAERAIEEALGRLPDSAVQLVQRGWPHLDRNDYARLAAGCRTRVAACARQLSDAPRSPRTDGRRACGR